jgi:hypothetical protein
MSWHYLPELAEACWEVPCWDGGPFAPWKKSRTAGKCSSDASGTACWTCSQFGTMPEHSTVSRGVELWIAYLRDSHVSPSVWPASVPASEMSEISGPKPSESFAKWDPDLRYWKTYPALFLQIISARSSETWRRQGSMRNGRLFRRRTPEPRTSESDCGSWPTPSARDWKSGKASDATMERNSRPLNEMVGRFPTPTAGLGMRGGRGDLLGQVRGYSYKKRRHSSMKVRGEFPTPTANRRDGLQSHGVNVVTGSLNPNWVEWLMAWPIGWTDLKPLGTDKFQQWWDLHFAS